VTSRGGRPGAVAYVLCEAFAIGLAATAALSSAFVSIVLLGVAALISIGWAVGRAPLVRRSQVTIARVAPASRVAREAFALHVARQGNDGPEVGAAHVTLANALSQRGGDHDWTIGRAHLRQGKRTLAAARLDSG
jgi:hypothetical protein